MIKRHITAFLLLVITTFYSVAQNDTGILMTVNDQEVTVSEFKKVYKKNLDLVQDDAQKDVRNYLELYKDYKLKVAEAYAKGYAEKTSYKKELAGYKRQLARNYMTNNTVTEALVREAYDRSINEVKARHILVRVPEGALAADTLKAYQKIQQARDRILNNEDFDTVAKAMSEDPSVQTNGGDLGWFQAFSMVYPFENAAYNTSVNDISEPFRTRFGYHIVQTTGNRVSEGKRIVRHIMVAKEQQDKNVDPAKRIQELYSKYQQGESFPGLATQYSEDQKSARKGGKLGEFGRGQLASPVFEDVAFQLENEEDVSAPFETKFGWHIVQLIEKKFVGSLEDERFKIDKRVRRDGRAKKITASFMRELRDEYNVSVSDDLVSYFETITTDALLEGNWKFDPALTGLSQTAFRLKDSIITYKEAGEYLEKAQVKSKKYASKSEFIQKKLDDYLDLSLRAYHTAHLEELNSDYANVLREYREGLLLFDLMENEVWNKAKLDTVGQKRYFNNHREDYKWSERAQLLKVSGPNKQVIENVRRELKAGKTIKAIKDSYNKNGRIQVFFTNKTVSKGDEFLPKGFKYQKGFSNIIKGTDFMFFEVKQLLPEGLKTYEEVKGQVISDCQSQLEEEWLQSLKDKATIEVNERVLKEVVKELLN